MRVDDLATPALCVDLDALDHNIDTMAAARPGAALRPHVKAFKSTSMARLVAERGGHRSFCCATLREMEGMVGAGLGHDLLLANETLDSRRLGALVASSPHRVTVAVDSVETVDVAAQAGGGDRALAVLIDVNVGLPRCGCEPEDAAALAARADAAGLEVRGVMGYEGHVVGNPDRAWRTERVEESVGWLRRAHDEVGGITSMGGTGTYDLHRWADEVQAGSYLLMDTHYARLELPFRQAIHVWATVISVNAAGPFAVADAGLKSFGMDHGEPRIEGYGMFFSSDEHATFTWPDDADAPRVGDRVRMIPAHVDPTVALHERIWVTRGDEVVDEWTVDLRNW